MDEDYRIYYKYDAHFILHHGIMVNGVDVLAMPLHQLQSIYSVLFPDVKAIGRSYEELINCIVHRLIYILTNKNSAEAMSAQKVLHIESVDNKTQSTLIDKRFPTQCYPSIVKSLNEVNCFIPDVLIPSASQPHWNMLLKQNFPVRNVTSKHTTPKKKLACKYLRPSIVSMGQLGCYAPPCNICSKGDEEKKEDEVNVSIPICYSFLECQEPGSYLPPYGKSNFYFSECDVFMPEHQFSEIADSSSYIDTPSSNAEFHFSEI